MNLTSRVEGTSNGVDASMVDGLEEIDFDL